MAKRTTGRSHSAAASTTPAAATPPSTLHIRGLTKSYRGREVVRDVGMELRSGEVVGLLGPNGAGKTTCFYMIVGLVPLDHGEIQLNGEEIGHLPMHRRARLGVGYLPQEPSVFRKLSVEDNLLAILETLPDLTAAERRHRAETLMRDLHITDRRANLGLSLSGGERRRVEIARALATRPRFILLDEPFAGVDPISVIEIQSLVSHLRDTGIGVLITDHNVRETLKICDRAYIMSEGSVLAAGSPTEILENEKVKEVYLGGDFRL
jgi:lipopolysaccharide export system ATP-binding protein